MKRLHVLVEGQTEETVVRDVLSPHLDRFQISTTTIVLKTKRLKSGGTFKGGAVSTHQVLGDLRRLLGDSSATAVTTLIDYYRLPGDFPGMSTRPLGSASMRVAHVEGELARAIGDHRFVPHLTLHELEAWIFARPESCEWIFDRQTIGTMAQIRDVVGGPELIDDGPETAPSKRVEALFARYQKTFHGPLAIREVGLVPWNGNK